MRIAKPAGACSSLAMKRVIRLNWKVVKYCAVQAGERTEQLVAGRHLQLAAPHRRVAMEQLRQRAPRRHAGHEVRCHRAAERRREDREAPLQRLELRRADQRLGLQQSFGELVLRRVGVVRRRAA